MVSKQSGKENDSAGDVDAGVVTSPIAVRTSSRIKTRTKSFNLFTYQKTKRGNKTKTRAAAVRIAQRITDRQNNNSDVIRFLFRFHYLNACANVLILCSIVIFCDVCL